MSLVSISFGYGLLACIIGLIGVLISHYLPIGAVLIPAAFIFPAFYFYGNEVGILTVIMALVMLQRHMLRTSEMTLFMSSLCKAVVERFQNDGDLIRARWTETLFAAEKDGC